MFFLVDYPWRAPFSVFPLGLRVGALPLILKIEI
jgi:hypothetical protein